MRGFTLRAVPVFAAFACGCFLMPKTPDPNAAPAAAPTRAYWQQVSATLAQKPAGSDLPALVTLVRAQTEALRALPTDGVDAELVTAVEAVIKAEDEVLRRAEMADNSAAVLKENKQMAQVFADANRAAADAKKRVKALRPALNDRYNNGFPPLGG